MRSSFYCALIITPLTLAISAEEAKPKPAPMEVVQKFINTLKSTDTETAKTFVSATLGGDDIDNRFKNMGERMAKGSLRWDLLGAKESKNVAVVAIDVFENDKRPNSPHIPLFLIKENGEWKIFSVAELLRTGIDNETKERLRTLEIWARALQDAKWRETQP